MNVKTIAKKAGVSTATVSNVINGNYHKVSQETADRVRKIIEEMDYKPSATARSLASRESKIVGVVIPNLSEDEHFGIDPYIAQVVALLEQYVRRQGYYLMVRSVNLCREIVPIFSGWNVDGVILLGAFRDEVEEIEGLLDVPTVYADTYAKDLNIANVGIDDYKGGFLSARYLLGKGHRRIAFVGPDVGSPGVIQERYRGFCAAMAERKLELAPEDIFEAKTRSEAGVEVGKQIAFSDRGFTAVATMSDTLALGVIVGLIQSGLNVPDDVSVIGFDDLRPCRFMNPQITTISQNIEKKMQRVGDHLFQMIRTKERYAVNEVLDVEIVERQSVRKL